MQRAIEKVIVVTRRTRLEELIARFGTREQAKFYITHSGADFVDYQTEHEHYAQALMAVKKQLAQVKIKSQYIDRDFLPTFLFSEKDLVVTLGQDGLVVNTAKYLNGQPIVAINPDPARFDGVLLPFLTQDAGGVVQSAIRGNAAMRNITMAEAKLNDGQSLLAFNDLFIGCKSHVSARYSLTHQSQTEVHSSSGVLVATGAGSTGWLSSMFNMANSVMRLGTAGIANSKAQPVPPIKLEWDTQALIYVAREPFVSKASSAALAAGRIEAGQSLVLESRMPENGVIFSDGIETDYLEFNAGTIATIGIAQQNTHLVVR